MPVKLFTSAGSVAGVASDAARVTPKRSERTIEHGVTGMRVKPGDAAALAAALDAALAMPHAARAAMGAAARASVQARYTTAALQDATIEAYRAVLG